MADKDFNVRFWGVRGSIATSGPATQRAGGNTSCVEVRCGGRILLMDAGTGIREAGLALKREGAKAVDVFLTHAHWDHTIGLPFFKPLFSTEMTTRISAGHVGNGMSTQALVADLMRKPFLPVGPEVFCGNVEYRDVTPGEDIALDDIVLRTRPLLHPGGAIGYRIEHAGRSIAYVTDTEHEPGKLDSNVLDLIADCELMIYDCTYTEEELPLYRGYGHSTWKQAARLCRAAKARSFAIFHHHPSRSDHDLDAIEAQAQADFPQAFAARDGMTLKV